MTKKKELKAYTEIQKDGRMVAIASTEVEDRVGDKLKMSDWDLINFKKNPVLQAGHDHRPQFTVGIAKNIKIDGKKLTFEPQFHTLTDLAREIKAMYEEGILKAWSVGFIPYAELKKEGFGIDGKEKNELLEISAVAVPANQEALTMLKDLSKAMEGKEDLSPEISSWVSKSCCDDNALPKVEEEPEAETEEIDTEEKEVEEEVETEEKKVDEEVEIEKEEEVSDEQDIVEKGKKEKSPKCRQENETEDECVKRKIPELIEDGMDQEQAVAAAHSMCSKECSDKKELDEQIEKDLTLLEIEEKVGKVISKKNKDIITKTINVLHDAVGALEKLLELSEDAQDKEPETPVPAKGTDSSKGRDSKMGTSPNVIGKTKVVRALKLIASNSNFVLNQMNKDSK